MLVGIYYAGNTDKIYESWSYLRLLNDHKVGEVMTSSEVVSCNLVMG